MKVKGTIVLAAIAAMCITASASAAPTAGGTGAGVAQVKKLSAEPRTSIPFTVEYDAEGYYGPVKCTGKHQTNPRKYTGSRDVEKCESTSPPLLTVVGHEVGEWFPGSSGWASDYNGAAASSASYKVNAKATKFKIVAYYPPPTEE